MELFHPKYIFDCGPFIDLKNYPGDVFTSLWENFTKMINDGEILSSSEVFRELEEEAILLGKPYADPFVIAQAILHNFVLVHNEKYKPNAHKIPNVCKTFKVEEIMLFEFFRREKWKF